MAEPDHDRCWSWQWLLATPKYVSGGLSLGEVMQAAAAFIVVLGALNGLTENYVRVAHWSASARRVDELLHGLQGPLN